jgi:hypothetical protein
MKPDMIPPDEYLVLDNCTACGNEARLMPIGVDHALICPQCAGPESLQRLLCSYDAAMTMVEINRGGAVHFDPFAGWRWASLNEFAEIVVDEVERWAYENNVLAIWTAYSMHASTAVRIVPYVNSEPLVSYAVKLDADRAMIEIFERRGKTWLGRHPDDDDTIIGTWL